MQGITYFNLLSSIMFEPKIMAIWILILLSCLLAKKTGWWIDE